MPILNLCSFRLVQVLLICLEHRSPQFISIRSKYKSKYRDRTKYTDTSTLVNKYSFFRPWHRVTYSMGLDCSLIQQLLQQNLGESGRDSMTHPRSSWTSRCLTVNQISVVNQFPYLLDPMGDLEQPTKSRSFSRFPRSK